MVCDFLDCDDEGDRREIALSILEHVAPAGYFKADDAVTLDEWAESDHRTLDAVNRLAKQKRAFASRVRRLAARRSMTQSQLAERLGVTQPTVAAILSGQHRPQPKTIQKLADTLATTVDELWPQ